MATVLTEQQQRWKSYFVLLRVTYSPTIYGDRIVAFPLWQWLCERSTLLRNTFSAVLICFHMNLRVPWSAGNFFNSCKPVSFSRRTLHHGVSKYSIQGNFTMIVGKATTTSLHSPMVVTLNDPLSETQIALQNGTWRNVTLILWEINLNRLIEELQINNGW